MAKIEKAYSSVVVTDVSGSLIKSVDVMYYLSTSNSSLSGGSWATEPPAWVDGKYYWQKTVTTYYNDETSETEPVCISGTKGETGDTGHGIASITEEYYLSTSKTEQTGGEWTTTPPTWESGKYIWTRSAIVWSNPTSTTYTTPVCDSSWEAANDVKDELEGQITLINTSISSVTSRVDAVEKEIELKVEQTDITNAIDEYDKTISEGLRTRVSQIEVDIDGITSEVSDTQTLIEKVDTKVDNLQPTGLGWKVNYSNFATQSNGQIYLHGYDSETGESADVDGWVIWNGIKIVVPKATINPGTVCPSDTPIYVVRTTMTVGSRNQGSYLVWADFETSLSTTTVSDDGEGNVTLSSPSLSNVTDDGEGNVAITNSDGSWKYSVLSPTEISGDWEWNHSSDIILGSFYHAGNGKPIESAQIYTTAVSCDSVITSIETKTIIDQTKDTILLQASETYATKGELSVTDKKVAEIKITADEVSTEVANARGDSSSLKVRIDGIESNVVDVENNLSSTIAQTAGEIRSEVKSGDDALSSQISQTESAINSTIEDLDGRVSTNEQDIESLTLRISDAEGDYSELKLTVDEIESEVFNEDGSSKIEQTANEILSTVSSTYATQSDLEATQEDLKTAESAIKQNADNIALKVSTTTLSETLEGYSTKTETATAISESEKGIALSYATKTELTDVDDKFDDYSTTEDMNKAISAAITVSENGIMSNVTNAIDDIEIGGRNLLLNTSTTSGKAVIVKGATQVTSGISSWTNTSGVLTLNGSVSGSECCYRFMSPSNTNLYTLEAGNDYTISGKLKVSTTRGTLKSVNIRSQHSITSWTGGLSEVITDADTDEWVEFAFTHSIPEDALGAYFSVQVFYSSSWAGVVQLTELKLEKGNKATDWTPAPEDMATSEDVTTLSTRITQTEDTIQSQATAISNNATNISTLTQTATSITARLNSLQIGGRNLISGTSEEDKKLGGYPSSGYTEGVTGKTIDIPTGDNYVLSFEAKSTVSGDVIRCHFYNPNTTTGVEVSTGYTGTSGDGHALVELTDSWEKYWIRYTQNGANTTSQKNWIVGRRFKGEGTGTITVRSIKLEEGEYATDWTPAPEDVDSDVEDAKKQATNYLNLSEDGLVVGNMEETTDEESLGANVRIRSDGLDVRDGTAVLSSFNEDTIELGINSANTTISLCGGTGTISQNVNPQGDNAFSVNSTNIAIIGETEEIPGSSSSCIYSKARNSSKDKESIAYVNTNSGTYYTSTTSNTTYQTASIGMRAQGYSGGAAVLTVEDDFYSGQHITGSASEINLESQNALSLSASASDGKVNISSSGNTTIDAVDSISINGDMGIALSSDGNITANGFDLINNKILWSGAYYMTASHSCTLSEAVSAQTNGIVLIFSAYRSSASQNYEWKSYFIPKQLIASHGRNSHVFVMNSVGFGYIAAKILYVSNTTVTGNNSNTSTGTKNGVTYANNSFVLRYVIGV